MYAPEKYSVSTEELLLIKEHIGIALTFAEDNQLFDDMLPSLITIWPFVVGIKLLKPETPPTPSGEAAASLSYLLEVIEHVMCRVDPTIDTVDMTYPVFTNFTREYLWQMLMIVPNLEWSTSE